MTTSKTISRRNFLKTLALASSAAAIDWKIPGALAAQIQNKKELSTVFPHEKKGIHAFYKEMEQVIAELWEGKRLSPSIMETLEPLSKSCILQVHGPMAAAIHR
ncbi:MAG: twin-arginine translocation signal domain-containing protein [Desulfobacula sp.]|jgi:hypothetical protein|uniref:twin-arginine translocation signal domain-containing protein n=1 Tax=Desulfobacula sp. TaxID=2593537 RepID=UPI001DF7B52E|nr:twin-arginine translocation signal domain-containing protein [Desulfobacula sp.]MBT7710627.1 twin-arginine translocation signal domain-containing protein [Deltaproteobacteria bacterium]MBT3806205.1 twin-arginine translocation signal domain-containing protein [Desulfobacula sp.]MBT4025302.1 twin-arginine translocation signal domain-containing protein [Desulfobacula sp.]MBT4199369.1 twin-arginine translocation signal domain-containing protein [Desulfobacula sp.]